MATLRLRFRVPSPSPDSRAFSKARRVTRDVLQEAPRRFTFEQISDFIRLESLAHNSPSEGMRMYIAFLSSCSGLWIIIVKHTLSAQMDMPSIQIGRPLTGPLLMLSCYIWPPGLKFARVSR